jgi:hypothetical protein
MSTVSTAFAANDLLSANTRQKKNAAEAGNFDALLNEIDSKSAVKSQKEDAAAAPFAFVNHLIANIRLSLDKQLSNAPAPAIESTYGFTAEFDAVFGTTGPLPDFINMVTKKLGLSAEQNRAMQEISIRNKDITKTPDNVAKIAKELEEAGIGYR